MPKKLGIVISEKGRRWQARKISSALRICQRTFGPRNTTPRVISAVHFAALTSGRQTDFSVLEWPSTLYAVELLAWDIFLGLSLLCAAFVFVGSGIRAFTRWSLIVAGTLSLLGAIGPIVGDMALQRIGILGYGVGIPVAVSYYR